jgi:hypothetical protein
LPAQPAVGDWLGVITVTPDETLHVAVHIHKTPNGGYAGIYDNMDDAIYDGGGRTHLRGRQERRLPYTDLRNAAGCVAPTVTAARDNRRGRKGRRRGPRHRCRRSRI